MNSETANGRHGAREQRIEQNLIHHKDTKFTKVYSTLCPQTDKSVKSSPIFFLSGLRVFVVKFLLYYDQSY